MPLRDEYTLHQSDLGDFLSAVLWEEKNGSRLSVLSALARLDVDPWAEAARLAVLPKDVAASALVVILRQLPGQQPDASEAAVIADRLVTLLPEGGSVTRIPGDTSGHGARLGTSGRWLLVALMVVLAVWMMNRLWS